MLLLPPELRQRPFLVQEGLGWPESWQAGSTCAVTLQLSYWTPRRRSAWRRRTLADPAAAGWQLVDLLTVADATVAVEYDGAHHFDQRPQQWLRQRRLDVSRIEAMQDDGWLVQVMTSIDLLQHPDRAVTRTRSALLDHGWRP